MAWMLLLLLGWCWDEGEATVTVTHWQVAKNINIHTKTTDIVQRMLLDETETLHIFIVVINMETNKKTCSRIETSFPLLCLWSKGGVEGGCVVILVLTVSDVVTTVLCECYTWIQQTFPLHATPSILYFGLVVKLI
jgi:hypothetical protein